MAEVNIIDIGESYIGTSIISNIEVQDTNGDQIEPLQAPWQCIQRVYTYAGGEILGTQVLTDKVLPINSGETHFVSNITAIESATLQDGTYIMELTFDNPTINADVIVTEKQRIIFTLIP